MQVSDTQLSMKKNSEDRILDTSVNQVVSDSIIHDQEEQYLRSNTSPKLDGQQQKEQSIKEKIKKRCSLIALGFLMLYLIILQIEVISQKMVTVKFISEIEEKINEKQILNTPTLQKKELEMIIKGIEKDLEQYQVQNPALIFPKVFWLYSRHKFQAEKMLEQMLGNFIVQKARQSKFQIRFVNSWSAYQWLSNQTTNKITKAMHNTHFEVSVDDLLRLALLMEHGGVTVRLDEIFYIGKNFEWLKDHLMFDQNSREKSEVFLFSQNSGFHKGREYQDFFIAAVKGAELIRDIFNILAHSIMTGELQFRSLGESKFNFWQNNATRVGNFTLNIIQSLLEIKSPAAYSVSTIQNDVKLFRQDKCQKNLHFLLRNSIQRYEAICGPSQHVLHIVFDSFTRQLFEDQLEADLLKQSLGAVEGGHWHNWMTIHDNRKLFTPLPSRNISFCLIDAHPNKDILLLRSSFERLKSQTFREWTAVYFVKNLGQQMTVFSEEQKKQGYRVELVIDTGSIGRNYQIGIIHHCPNKSFVLILKQEERLALNNDLQVLADSVAPRGVLGAFVKLNVSNKIYSAESNYSDYSRHEYNSDPPRQKDLNIIHNHLRVFHSDCYKIIPQFQLRNPEGEYFNDRFSFLEQFLFMVNTDKVIHDVTQIEHTQRVRWFIKANRDIFDVPNTIILHDELTINIQQIQAINQKQWKRNYYKIDAFNMKYNLDHMLQTGVPMNELAVFNPGLEYEPYTARKKPDIIPKKIHLIWIDGKMPFIKEKIMDMNKELYPDYQWRHWTKDDITKENFPFTYNILQNLYRMENISRYSKRASMADIMRQEIIYHHGGFYMDSSMFLFSNIFNRWLSYKLVMPTERTFRHRWSQSMCIFGMVPQFANLLRGLSANNTNRFNIWSKDALSIAGPNNFRYLVRGMEQYDPDYLIMAYDSFYPMAYDISNPYLSYCLIDSKQFQTDNEIVTEYQGWNMIKNCGKYYPYSYGREASNIGGSWVRPKW